MTTSNDPGAPLEKGQMRIYDNAAPTLAVGDYLINWTQRINPRNTEIDESSAASQAFSVQGPRYALPTEDMFSVFPPENAQGVFDQFLPHIVLAKRDVPWERAIFKDEELNRQSPWMALLLFVEGEQIKGQETLLIPQVEQWTPNQTRTAPLLARDFYWRQHAEESALAEDGTLWPDLHTEWYESDEFLQTTGCSIIELSPQAFTTLLAGKDDLPYLAHARQVNSSAKDSGVLKISGDGWYSVIVGNRLPDPPTSESSEPGKLNIAHLVSLEGFQDYIDGTKRLPAKTTRVRMISFKSWTFTCLPELGESFSALMNGLLKDQQGKEKSTAFLLPADRPVTDDAEAGYAYAALRNGYVPVPYQTRLGEQTFAWYRGPFAPIPVNNFLSATQQGGEDQLDWQPFTTASSALIYDKEYGIFDVSYAVAWETGCLLALSDGAFGPQLLNWQRTGHRLVDLIVERSTQIAAFQKVDPGPLDPQVEKGVLDLITSYAVTDGFMTALVTQFSEQITPKMSGESSNAPDPPFPPYPDRPSPVANPQTVTDLLKEPVIQDAIRELGGRNLAPIADWLAQLYLLIGVPFENLVPHADLLPAESVRFFYIDSNWLGAMMEGALSIGVETSRDCWYQDLMKDLIWNTTFATVQQIRDRQLGTLAGTASAEGTLPFDQEAMTGMVLRSAVVAGWPGLQCNAYAQSKPGSAEPDTSSHINVLRMQRLSNDILLCLWPTVPAVVTIDEPHEGVAFGFEDSPEGEGYFLYLRSLDPPTYGRPLKPDKQIDAVASKLFDPITRLVNISGSGGILEHIRNMLPSPSPVSIRDFAVQMIKVPEQAVFAAHSLNGKEQL